VLLTVFLLPHQISVLGPVVNAALTKNKPGLVAPSSLTGLICLDQHTKYTPNSGLENGKHLSCLGPVFNLKKRHAD
jgi:hypothetical protein